jgi:hypothetical protein
VQDPPAHGLLNKTDSHHDGAGVPCRAERERRIGPIIAELAKRARRAGPARRRDLRSIPIPTKETSMTESRKPGGIIEGPYTEPVRPTTNGQTPAGLPLDVLNELADWQRQFVVPNMAAVRSQKCVRLAGYLLDRPPGAARELLARVLYELGLRGAGRR